mmetsp:Transcript_60248/g.159665  ORF Transcript_60248/g.159665 Transcript_60248/m.159665 type:complete len:144 (+) Transcript_60248:97-528(+)
MAPPAPMSHSSLTRVRLSIMSGAVNANKLPGKLISSGFPAASGAVSNEPTASAVSTVVILVGGGGRGGGGGGGGGVKGNGTDGGAIGGGKAGGIGGVMMQISQPANIKYVGKNAELRPCGRQNIIDPAMTDTPAGLVTLEKVR